MGAPGCWAENPFSAPTTITRAAGPRIPSRPPQRRPKAGCRMKKKPPEFCDFDCPYADFPPADTAGICRTMSAVWCKQLKELVNKNALCEWRKRRPARTAKQRPGPRPPAKKRKR